MIFENSLAGAATPEWLTYTGNVELFGSRFVLNDGSSFNPDNSLGSIPNADLNLVTRLNASAKFGSLDVALNPRASGSLAFGDEDRTTDDDAYLQEWFIGYTVADWQLSYSRELTFWGPSLFSSPSNPFYGSSDQSNPFIELGAREFVRLDGTFDAPVQLSFIVNTSEGRDLSAPADFDPSFSVKGEYTGESFFGGLIATHDTSVDRLGLFGQMTVSDALLLYADTGLKSSSSAIFVPDGQPPSSFDFGTRGDSDAPYLDAVFGGSYTSVDGSTWALEYRRNTEGFDKSELDRYFDLSESAAASLRDDPTDEAARTALLLAADAGGRSLGRNYIHAEYFKRDLLLNLSVDLRLMLSLESLGGQLVSVVNYYVSDNLGFAANLVFNFGDEAGNEYRRYVDQVYFAGVKFYF